MTLLNENPINNPRVPPTDPIILIESWIKYSSCTSTMNTRPMNS